MSEYIQVGVTAMRDPLTGEFLPAVPMYIREEDRDMVAMLTDMDIGRVFAEKFKQYRREARKEGKHAPVREMREEGQLPGEVQAES